MLVLSKALIVLMLILLLPTGLVLASQDSLPGDRTYPIKRSLENIIISLVSVHPSTRALFTTNFSQRRFKEAVAMIKRNDDSAATISLVEMISQTREAAAEINKISDPVVKKQLSEKLSKQISEYKQQLVSIQQTQQNQYPSGSSTPGVQPSLSPPQPDNHLPSLLPSRVPTGNLYSPTPTRPALTSTPTVSRPTSPSPVGVRPSPAPIPSSRPTPTIFVPSPTINRQPTPTPVPQLPPGECTAKNLQECIDQLGRIPNGSAMGARNNSFNKDSSDKEDKEKKEKSDDDKSRNIFQQLQDRKNLDDKKQETQNKDSTMGKENNDQSKGEDKKGK